MSVRNANALIIELLNVIDINTQTEQPNRNKMKSCVRRQIEFAEVEHTTRQCSNRPMQSNNRHGLQCETWLHSEMRSPQQRRLTICQLYICHRNMCDCNCTTCKIQKSNAQHYESPNIINNSNKAPIEPHPPPIKSKRACDGICITVGNEECNGCLNRNIINKQHRLKY